MNGPQAQRAFPRAQGTMRADEVIIYVVDAGSHASGKFHWVASSDLQQSSNDPGALASAIVKDLRRGRRVALGYESPLFVPVATDTERLGRARPGECQVETGNRPFTAGAGAAVLATGIQSLAWVLREIQQASPNKIPSTSTRWSDFLAKQCDLFVWEAFVSGSEKAVPPSHAGDAALAIRAFMEVMSRPENPTRIPLSQAFSLAGAAILWAGLSQDVALLSEPCVVLRPLFSQEESAQRVLEYKRRQMEAAREKRTRKQNGDGP